MLAVARIGRVASKLIANKATPQVKTVRHGSEWAYRQYYFDKKGHQKTYILGSFVFAWVIYHLYFEHEHIYGEFSYPNPKSFTDKELGIPPLDE